MGYGSISFFVCFPLMNQIVILLLQLLLLTIDYSNGLFFLMSIGLKDNTKTNGILQNKAYAYLNSEYTGVATTNEKIIINNGIVINNDFLSFLIKLQYAANNTNHTWNPIHKNICNIEHSLYNFR